MNTLIYLLIGFLASFIISLTLGSIIIPLLKRFHINQCLSVYLRDEHRTKINTPTMGGLIFILGSFLTMCIFFIFNKLFFSYNLIIVLFTFLGYFLIGFIDDFLIIKRHNNDGLSEKEKLFSQAIIAALFFLLFLKADNEPLLWIHLFNIKLDIGWFYGLFILFVLVASSNAVNLTDGLDGLAGGLAVVSFLTLGVITLNTGWLEGYLEISLFCFILAASILGFLFYNINPAKVFMGDTGSLAIGATLGCISILTRHELLLILIGSVFVIETLSCLIQRYYFKLTHKRIFKMAPIHHSLEKSGWSEVDIVKLFWTIGLISSIIALIYGVWL